MHLPTDGLAPTIFEGTAQTSGVHLQGFIFENPEEVRRYFSMYGAHILGGTVMAGGGYNANEWTDGSILQIFRTKIFPEIQYKRGILSADGEKLKHLQSVFDVQYPLWSGLSGHEDVKTKLWENFGHLGDLESTVSLSVDFVIQCDSREHIFKQDYLLGFCKRKELGITLVHSRESLYQAYRGAFSVDYPLDNVQPYTQKYQIDPQLIASIKNRK